MFIVVLLWLALWIQKVFFWKSRAGLFMSSCCAFTKPQFLMELTGSLCSTVTSCSVEIICQYFHTLTAISDVFLYCMALAFRDMFTQQHHCPVYLILSRASFPLTVSVQFGIICRAKDVLHSSLMKKQRMSAFWEASAIRSWSAHFQLKHICE